jgi:hypothetical protein
MPLQLGLQSIKDIFGNILGRRFSLRKIGEIIEKGVIQAFQYLFHTLFQELKVDDDAFFIQLTGDYGNLHLPVVTMELA